MTGFQKNLSQNQRVGISGRGLSIHFMQKEKFKQADMIEVDDEPLLSSKLDIKCCYFT